MIVILVFVAAFLYLLAWVLSAAAGCMIAQMELREAEMKLGIALRHKAWAEHVNHEAQADLIEAELYSLQFNLEEK